MRQKLCDLLQPHLRSHRVTSAVLCCSRIHNAIQIQGHGTQTSPRTCSHFSKPPPSIFQREEDFSEGRWLSHSPEVIQLDGESLAWLLHNYASLSIFYKVQSSCTPQHLSQLRGCNVSVVPITPDWTQEHGDFVLFTLTFLYPRTVPSMQQLQKIVK